MKKTKCYSVRLHSLTRISPKCWKAEDFNGNTSLIPDSQLFGQDWEVQKSSAYWIAAWVLERSDLIYSHKKVGWYNPELDRVESPVHTIIERHVPERISPVENNIIPELKKLSNEKTKL